MAYPQESIVYMQAPGTTSPQDETPETSTFIALDHYAHPHTTGDDHGLSGNLDHFAFGTPSPMLDTIDYSAPVHAQSSSNGSIDPSVLPSTSHPLDDPHPPIPSSPMDDTFAQAHTPPSVPEDAFRTQVGSDARFVASIQRRRKGGAGRAPHACAYCDRTFTRKANLDDHVQRHENHRRYSCQCLRAGEACTSRFNTVHDLKSHLKLVHHVL